MIKTENQSVLVVFGDHLPQKSKTWWQQFNEVIGPQNLKGKIQDKEIVFIDIEGLIDSDKILDGFQLADKLSRITLPDGRRLSKLINYQGYELWWMGYDGLMQTLCLPYIQYRRLLTHLKDFNNIYLYQPPFHYLFQYFLKAHNCKCIILNPLKGFRSRLRKLFPIPLGVFIQVILSLISLLWLKFTRPKLMLYTGDFFDPSHDYDFRMRLIYEELRKKKIPFVEFIRSLEPTPTVLAHAWQRKRPVIYSAAIVELIQYLTQFLENIFGKRKEVLIDLPAGLDPEEHFWLLVATHYLRNITGTIWSLRLMKFILRWIGIKAAIIIRGSSRTFHEVLACKLSNIKTVGIQHGATVWYNSSDFMPSFDGKLPLSVDRYGLWSNYWREYFLSHGRAYRPEQLYISGHMRPLERKMVEVTPRSGSATSEGPAKVLFISEELAISSEVMPYLLALVEVKDFSVYLKFRPYRDCFEEWLKKNRPDALRELLKKVKVFRGNIHEAIAQSDVIVGTYSTSVLEALLQLKPFIFFQTDKWGDFFEIKPLDHQNRFFAENPKELIEKIKNSINIPKEDLRKLQEKFFGDPYRNGSKWVVDQAEDFIKNYKSK